MKLEEITNEIRNGNEKNINDFYKMLIENFTPICRSFFKTNDFLVEEAISKSILLIYSNINRLRDINNFNAWCIRVVKNVCCRLYRNEVKNNMMNLADVDVDKLYEYPNFEDIADSISVTRVRDIYDKEQPLIKKIVKMRIYEEMTPTEISKALGIKNSTVRSKYCRFMKKIKEIKNTQINS